MKRIFYFIVVNIAILFVLSIFLSLTGFTGILQSNGVDLDYDSLMLFSLVFGMGGSLLEMAEQQTDTDFVGIEVHPPGVGSLINAAQEKQIKNLKVYLADATDVLSECFSDNSIDRIQLYFPDPWHKKKHNKRRIVQPKFLQLIREKLRLGGVVHMATDWQRYAEQMLEVVGEADGFKNMAPDDVPRPDFRPLTKFERRGERLGHGVWDLMAERTL